MIAMQSYILYNCETLYSGFKMTVDQNALKRMVRQRETSDDNPKLLKDEWNKFAYFLEDNTYPYEITSIYHEARKRVSAKYN